MLVGRRRHEDVVPSSSTAAAAGICWAPRNPSASLYQTPSIQNGGGSHYAASRPEQQQHQQQQHLHHHHQHHRLPRVVLDPPPPTTSGKQPLAAASAALSAGPTPLPNPLYRHASVSSLSQASSIPCKPTQSDSPQQQHSKAFMARGNALRIGRGACIAAAAFVVTLLLSACVLVGLAAIASSGDSGGAAAAAGSSSRRQPPECVVVGGDGGAAKTSLKSAGAGANSNICLSESCVRLAANYLNNMNTEVAPCDDFYEFACGQYASVKVIPEHERKATVLSEMKMGLDRHLRRILEGTTGDQTYVSGPLAMARTYYESCMDEAAIDEVDLLPLNSLISRLGGWPLLTNARFDSSDFHWEVLASHAALLGRGGLFRLFVHSSFTQSDRNIIMLSPPRLLLEKRKYYAAPLDSNPYLQKYKQYMLEFLELLGAEREAVEPQVDNILVFETQIANATQRDNQRNHTAINNAVRFGDFKMRLSKIKWDLYLNDEMRTYLAPLSEATMVNVLDPAYFDRMSLLLTGSRMQVINDYIWWQLVSSLDAFLPRRFRAPAARFRAWLGASDEDAEPAWEACVRLARAHLGAPLASAYARKFFSASDRAQAIEMIDDLKAAMAQALLTADWMDDSTRAAAVAKLEQMGHKVGYPDWLFNETHVLAPYAGVKLQKKRFFENAIALEKAAFRELLLRLHAPATRDAWASSIIAVDAFHYFNANEIIFPAGILQFPMFVPEAPAFVNYGAIGMGIGHEITHGYDDLGAQYDGGGNLRGWWRPDTMRVFQSKKACFVAQYGARAEPLTGRKLDGRLTVGENIADNGGLRVAYQAYHIRTARQHEQQRLPALANFTDQQMFFIAYANTWCESVRPSAVNYILDTDVHALGRFRVNVPLQNFPAFSTAFECPIGAPMNPFEKCRIW